MADFKLFEPILLKQEGLYSNKAKDSGGETWEGISRNNYPTWPGWGIIDAAKRAIHFVLDKANIRILNTVLKANTSLQELVDAFYKCAEWDTMWADQIANQSIANFLVDWGVNAGQSVPIRHAQEILGITADGKIGPQTVAAINGAAGPVLFEKLQRAREQFYMDVVTAHPQDKAFLGNWLERNASFKFSA